MLSLSSPACVPNRVGKITLRVELVVPTPCITRRAEGHGAFALDIFSICVEKSIYYTCMHSFICSVNWSEEDRRKSERIGKGVKSINCLYKMLIACIMIFIYLFIYYSDSDLNIFVFHFNAIHRNVVRICRFPHEFLILSLILYC